MVLIPSPTPFPPRQGQRQHMASKSYFSKKLGRGVFFLVHLALPICATTREELRQWREAMGSNVTLIGDFDAIMDSSEPFFVSCLTSEGSTCSGRCDVELVANVCTNNAGPYRVNCFAATSNFRLCQGRGCGSCLVHSDCPEVLDYGFCSSPGSKYVEFQLGEPVWAI